MASLSELYGGSGSKNSLSELYGGKKKKNAGFWDKGVVGAPVDLIGRLFSNQPVQKALDIVDSGRAGVLAGIRAIDDVTEGRGLDGDLFMERFRERQGVGDWMEEEHPDANPWLKRAVGFVGDVALDPLTYASFGASAVAKGGAKGVTRLGWKEVADRAISAEAYELAAKVNAKRTSSALTKAEADRLGIKVGMTMGVGKARFAVPGSEKVVRAGAKVISPQTAKVGRGLEKIFDTVKHSDPVIKRQIKPYIAATRAAGQAVTHHAEVDLNDVAKKYRGTNPAVVGRLMEAPDVAGEVADIAGPEIAAARELAEVVENAAKAAEEATGKQIPRLKDYLSHQLTREFKDMLDEEGVKAGGARQGLEESFERTREHGIGELWFGQRLQHGTLAEMEGIAKDVFGDDYIKVFKDNPWELAHGYARSLGNMVTRERLMQALVKTGLAKRFDADEWAKLEGAIGLHKSGIRAMKAADAAEGDLDALVGGAPDGDVLSPDLDVIRQEIQAAADTPHATLLQRLKAEDGFIGRRVRPSATTPEGIEASKQAALTAGTVLKTARDRAAWEKNVERAAAKRQAASEYIQENAPALDQFRAIRKNWDELTRKNAQLLDELMDEVDADPNGRAAEEAIFRRDAQEWVERLDETNEMTERGSKEMEDFQRIAKLEATAAMAAADMVRSFKKVADVDDRLANMARKMDQSKIEMFDDMVQRGLRSQLKADPDLLTDPETAQLVDDVLTWTRPQEQKKFWRAFDRVHNQWKAYSLLSFGYHSRNSMGGIFNNSLADVNPTTYAKFIRADKQFRKGGLEAISDPKIRDAFAKMDELNVFGGKNIRDLSDVQGGNTLGIAGAIGKRLESQVPASRINMLDPTSLDFGPLRANNAAAQRVERSVRGPLFLDRILKGATPEEALQAVHKYHFDYDDLTDFERMNMRRVMPFYTWTRKNLPLQLERMMLTPGKYTRYQHLANNVELGTEEDPIVPEYFEEMFLAKTPFENGDGDPFYGGIDLPFTRLEDTFDWKQAAASTSPFFKTPVELAMNKQFFSGIPIQPPWAEPTPMPKTWTWMAPALKAMGGKLGAPKVTEGPDGELLIDRGSAYKIEQMMPVLGRARRLLPTEGDSNYSEKHTTSLISFFLGLNARVLDDTTVRFEKQRLEEAEAE